MDPGVRSHGMKADPPGYLWSKYECFLMSGWWDILHSSCLHVKLWSNSTNGTEVRTNKQTNEHTNGQTESQKLYTPWHKCRGYNKDQRTLTWHLVLVCILMLLYIYIGDKCWCQQKALITLPICCFKQSLWSIRASIQNQEVQDFENETWSWKVTQNMQTEFTFILSHSKAS